MKSKTKVHLAKYKNCTGCLACADACNHSALKVIKRGELFYPTIDQSVCIECRLCQNTCPVVTPISLNKAEDIIVRGGWAADESLREAGATGGAFAGMAKAYMAQHKGQVAVYGASLKENRVHHERITSFDDIYLFMNSKYIQSDTRGIYKRVREDLKENRYVLFSGTPCQIAGLYGFLGRKRDDAHLLTVELICAGVMSPEALDIHLENNHSKRIISFRSKINGGNYGSSQRTTIEIDGKPYRFENRYDDDFYRCFSSSILERRSCFNCQYAKLERGADITIGDFWGGEKDFPDYDKGVNVILANNSKAESFLAECNSLVLVKSDLKKAISGNPCLYHGVNLIKLHPLVVFPNLSRKILPRKTWVNIVKNNTPWRYLWAVYRLLSIGYVKLQYKRIKAKYSNIL